MIATYIYSLLVFILFLYSLFKNTNIIAKLLTGLYFIISVFSIVSMHLTSVSSKQISFIPFAFLALNYFIFFQPFFCSKDILSADKLVVRKDKMRILFLFLLVYSLTALVSVTCYFPYIVNLVQSGNWKDNLQVLYNGDMTFPYKNSFEHYSVLFSSYFYILALLSSFYCLKVNKYKKLSYLTILLVSVKELFSAIYVSSRGMIVNYGLLLIGIILFFFKFLDIKKKNLITILSVISIVTIIPYFIDVTISRFTSAKAWYSVVDYLGLGPLAFNYGVFNISKLSFGKFAFGTLFGQNEFDPILVGGSWGTSFYTFVGWIYIDWGFLGTIIIGLLVSFGLGRIIKKKRFYMSDLLLIFFYYKTLLDGVFVIGRTYNYSIIFTVLLCLGLKCIEKIYFGFDEKSKRMGLYDDKKNKKSFEVM